MKPALATVFASALFAFAPAARSNPRAPTAPSSTISLLSDRTLSDWRLVTTPAASITKVCRLDPDGVLWIAGRPGGFLQTTTAVSNFTLHVEWRWPGKPGNGGILVRISSGPKDRVWPLAYQIQLKHGFAGDILPMAGAAFATLLSTPPGARIPIRSHLMPDSERPPGDWNACDITCQGGELLVSVNEVLQNRIEGCVLKSGQIGIQFEGTPMEFRNLRVTPLP